MKVYKVLQRVDDKLFSAVVEDIARVEYKIGEYSEAPQWLQDQGYHITAFQNLIGAKSFIIDDMPCTKSELEIYKCEARDIFEKAQLPPSLTVWELQQLFELDEYILPVRSSVWPWGTIMCLKLKPVRKIEF